MFRNRFELPFNRVARIQLTAYYGLHYRYTLEVLRKEKKYGCRKIQEKSLSLSVPFSLPLQPYIPDFLTSANADCKKSVSFENSEIVGSLPELKHLIKTFD